VPNVAEEGRIFIREGTPLPEALRFESSPYMPGWRVVEDLTASALGRKIHDAGWTFFSLAYEAKATVFGIDGEKMVRRAIERMLANPQWEKFNSLQIVRVASLASRRFLGIRHLTVSAQSRHIQQSPFLFRAPVKGLEPGGTALGERPGAVVSIGSELPLDTVETPSLESVRI
jgi:hypothetical protein